MSVSDEIKNRGAHGDSSFMLGGVPSSSENHQVLSVGSVKIDEVLQEIMLRLVDLVLQGGKAEKIIVSEKVYDLFMSITLMPRSVRYENSVFYIADVPVEAGKLDDPKGDIWFKIE